MNIREYLSDFMDDAIFFEGFDEAIIGYGEGYNLSVVLYDAYKCIELLMEQGMTDEESWDFFNFNVVNSYVGTTTPIFCYMEDEEPEEVIIGYGERCGLSVILYDAQTYINNLVRDGMEFSEATEYFEQNILCNTHIGEEMPLYCYLL